MSASVSQKPRAMMSASQVAERLGVTRRTVDLWVKQGRFPQPVRHGETAWPRWRRSDVEAWAAGEAGDRDRLATILLRAAENCSDPRVAEWFRCLAAGDGAASHAPDGRLGGEARDRPASADGG